MRKYKAKTDRGHIDNVKIRQAVEMVKNSRLSISQAAAEFQINKSCSIWKEI